MADRSEQLEREAGEARDQLREDIGELRARIRPRQMLDRIGDYARRGPAADRLRELGREVRGNPIPLLLIGAGVAWLAILSRQSRPSARTGGSRFRAPPDFPPPSSVPWERAPFLAPALP